MKKTLSLILCFIGVISVFSCSLSEGLISHAVNEELIAEQSSNNTYNTYSDYMASLGDVKSNVTGGTITINALEHMASNTEDELNDELEALIVDTDETYEWEFEVENTGFYNIGINISAAEDGRGEINFSALIDGEQTFKELSLMDIPRRWVDETTEKLFDSNGNQIRPQSVQDFTFRTEWFKDSEGLHSDYFCFYLSEGIHKLSITGENGKFALKGIVISPADELISYEEYLKENNDIEKYNGETVIKEAEEMLWRSSVSIMSQSDMQSPYTTPYSAAKTLYNTTGGANWKYPWDTICWNVNVPEDGLYKICIRYRQNYLSGMNVYRTLSVNGEIPFKEASKLSFSYSDDWHVCDFKDYYVRLNKGDNQISLTVTMSAMADTVRELQDILLEINKTYRGIIMIVGSNPDTNRDYNFDVELPNLRTELNTAAQRIEDVVDSFKAQSGAAGEQVSILMQFARQLREAAGKTYTLTRDGRLNGIKSNISSLGAFISTLREQALEIDSIYIGAEDMEPQHTSAGFFASAKHKFMRFIASFVEDYAAMGTGDKEAITVWLQSLGRDQMQILKNMVDDDFTAGTGIPVDLKLVTSSVVYADFAGRSPDVVINNSVNDPVNYALRGISADLSSMDEFDEVVKRFSPDSMISYKYKDKYYGLPENQSFSMMFIRKDVLEEMGVEVPQTWEQLVKHTLPILRHGNLEIGIGTLESIQSMTGYNIFTTLLYQNGGTIYEKDLMTSALDSVVAFESFSQALSYYKEYKFPQSYDTLNRFRSGEMPIIIASYTFYNNLAVGAPEISGLWEMIPIPGTEKEDGTIDRSQIFSSTASIILETSDKKEYGWQFLKWWSSAEVQSRYGLELEAVLGASGRYSPANIEATALLPWSKSELEALETQRSECISLEQMPGSYFTSKAINNAFLTCVLNDDKLPREEIIYWSEQIDLELERKRKEFDY